MQAAALPNGEKLARHYPAWVLVVVSLEVISLQAFSHCVPLAGFIDVQDYSSGWCVRMTVRPGFMTERTFVRHLGGGSEDVAVHSRRLNVHTRSPFPVSFPVPHA